MRDFCLSIMNFVFMFSDYCDGLSNFNAHVPTLPVTYTINSESDPEVDINMQQRENAIPVQC